MASGKTATQLTLAAMPPAPVQQGPDPRELKRTYRELLKQAGRLMYEAEFHLDRARKESRDATFVPTLAMILSLEAFIKRLAEFEAFARSIDPTEQCKKEANPSTAT